ncbi:phosphoenolpyruvate carboxylase [Pseudonocardia sp. MCCB 268]|nr:phosphoenolpyruvate carboxylase [Pseudonocardia cytotoxica]
MPPGFRPTALGCWVGGDRDGNLNVTAATTVEAVRLRRTAPRDPLPALVTELQHELSVSSRVVGVSEGAAGRLRPTTVGPCPEVCHPVDEAEPYRVKCGHRGAVAEHRRTALGLTLHVPGRGLRRRGRLRRRPSP